MGDVNNGLYFGDPALRFGQIRIDDPKAMIGLAFQVVNAGNAGPEAIMGRLQATGDVLAGTAGGLGAGGLEALNLLWSWLVVDCDGVCATDLILTPRIEFDQLTAVTGRFDLTRFYPGKPSPVGCGSNSRYAVTLSIVRDDANADLAAAPTCLIVNRNSALCLDVPGFSGDDGQRIQQYQLNYGDNQRWMIQPTDDAPLGPAKTYTIRSVSSRKCLDVPDGNPADQVPINQFACNGGANQQWRFIPVNEFGQMTNFFEIVNQATGKCIDVPDASRQSAQPIQQFTPNGGSNQMWKLLP